MAKKQKVVRKRLNGAAEAPATVDPKKADELRELGCTEEQVQRHFAYVVGGDGPSQINGAAAMTGPGPVKTDPGVTPEEVASALEAWKRIRVRPRKIWLDFRIIGAVLRKGRQWALKEADTHKPRGAKYSQAMNRWLKTTGMDKLFADEAVTRKLLWLMDPVVEEWLEDFPEDERFEWHHPNTLYRIAHCKQPNSARGIPFWRVWRAAVDAGETKLNWAEWRSEGKSNPQANADTEATGEAAEPSTDSNGNTYTVKPGKEVEAQSQKKWEKNLHLLASKVSGARDGLSRMVVIKPTEPGLKRLVQQAADDLAWIAEQLPDDADFIAHRRDEKAEAEDRVAA